MTDGKTDQKQPARPVRKTMKRNANLRYKRNNNHPVVGGRTLLTSNPHKTIPQEQ